MHSDRDLLGLLNDFSLSRLNFRQRWLNRLRWKSNPEPANNDRNKSAADSAVKDLIKLIKPTTKSKQPQATIFDRNPVKRGVTYPKPAVKVPETPSLKTNDTPTAETTIPVDNQTTSPVVQKQWSNFVNLNMNFNLAQFERTISELANDAADGEIETQTLSKLNIGLHVDLTAMAQSTSKTKIESTDGQSVSNSYSQLNVSKSETRALKAMVKSREYEAKLFYRESLKSRYSEKQVVADGFIRTSRKLAMRYTQDFSFNFKSLQMFNSQAAALTQTGEADQYINTTENMVDNPQVTGDVIGQFFDSVQGYIGNMESALLDKVNEFFDNLAGQMGISSDQLEFTRDTIINGIESFFDKVDQAVTNATGQYLPPPGENPEPAAIPDAETADVEDQAELVPA
jgi:hypothetical protein